MRETVDRRAKCLDGLFVETCLAGRWRDPLSCACVAICHE
jgi:hypothetical protein